MKWKPLFMVVSSFFILLFAASCEKEQVSVTINHHETKMDASVLNILSKTDEPVPKVALTAENATYDIVYKKNHYYVFTVKASPSSNPDRFVRVPHLDTQYEISSYEYEQIQKAAQTKPTH